MPAIKNNLRWSSLLFVITASIFILYQFDLTRTSIITDAVVNGALIAATAWIGIITINNYPTKVGILVYALFIGIAAGFIAWLFSKLFLAWWFNGDREYLKWLRQLQIPRLIIFVLITCWVTTLTAIRKHITEVEGQFKNMTDAATLHREAELFKLRQQLQPHFLYNSLNSINALILLRPDKAQEMIGRLSDFLRHSVKREGREQIPIEEELDYIQSYLAIESVRFGDRLKVVYQKEAVDAAVIPPFLLQPILENAIKFGLYGRTGEVNIDVHIRLQSSYLTIAIVNPFDPAHKPPSGTGFGLEGIRRRLYLLYARTDLLETKTSDETFTTILKIPQANV